jgi:hypothetical protein
MISHGRGVKWWASDRARLSMVAWSADATWYPAEAVVLAEEVVLSE